LKNTYSLNRTVRHDSLKTDGLSSFLLGEFRDDILGDVSKVNYYFQVRLGTPNVEFGGNAVLDSMVLSLSYRDSTSTYGEIVPMNLSLEQLSEGLDIEEDYYSYSSIPTEGIELIDPMQNPYLLDPTQSVMVGGEILDPQLRIRLDDLGEILINTSMDSLVSNNEFLPYFKGLKLSAERASGSDIGGMVGIDPYSLESKMTLYYHNKTDDSLFYDFAINSLSEQFMSFEHEYTGDILSQMNGVGSSQDQVYLQSGAGAGIEVTLPTIFDFASEENIVINRALLVLPVSEMQDSAMFDPNGTILATMRVDGELVSTPDASTAAGLGISQENGVYDAETGTYKVHITRFVQRLLNGQIDQPVLTLVPAPSRTVANRTIIDVGDPTEDRRIKLIINYTTY